MNARKTRLKFSYEGQRQLRLERPCASLAGLKIRPPAQKSYFFRIPHFFILGDGGLARLIMFS